MIEVQVIYSYIYIVYIGMYTHIRVVTTLSNP